jgi:hypothetical protein
MAITGSNSSASTLETEPASGRLVIGIPTGPAAEDYRGLAEALADPTVRPTCTVVVARPASTGTAREPAAPDDGLVEVRYMPRQQDVLEMPYHGLACRARAIHAIFAEAQAGGAAGCIIVDPRTTHPEGSIESFWRALSAHDADFVGPVYRRHPFSGGLIHGILAPFFSALYGIRLQYPVAPHFACSSRLMAMVLADPIWDAGAANVGIDWWLATAAAAGSLRVAQTSVAVTLRDDSPLVDLSTTIAQLLGFAFTDLERRVQVWQRIRGSRDVVCVGDAGESHAAPNIDAAAFVESFRCDYRDLREVWEEVLPPMAIMQWRRLTTMSQDGFRVADPVWARTIYDFAMGHRLRVIPRANLLRSLTPLYLAWLASFVLEMQGASTEALDARLARLRSAFEQEKPYLISQWRWPERFKPVKLRR